MGEVVPWTGGSNVPAPWSSTGRALSRTTKEIRAQLIVDDAKLDADLDFTAHAMQAVATTDAMAVGLASQCSPIGQQAIAEIDAAFGRAAAYKVARRTSS